MLFYVQTFRLYALCVFVPCIVCIKIAAYTQNDLPGVILVPGDGGAQLQAKLNRTSTDHIYCEKKSEWYTAWLNYLQMVPMTINCWTSNMILVYDNSTRTTHPPDGVQIRVPDFGDTATVEYLTDDRLYSYFAFIAETLASLGYERNKTLKGAPFDFRKAPNELSGYFTQLKALIESVESSTGGPVVLVAHSMGAPLLNYFLNQQSHYWRQKNIHCLVSLAGAWGGAVKAVKVYAAGDNLGSILNSLTLRTQQRTNPSLAFVLPDPNLWGEEVLVVTPSMNYTANDMPKYFQALNLPDAENIYYDVKDLFAKATTPPGVALHCLYGVGTDTVDRLEFASPKYFPDYPTEIFGPGDGTINLRSASLCEKYAQMQKEAVVSMALPQTDHMSILGSSSVLKYVAGIVTREAMARAAKRQQSSLNRYPSQDITATVLTNLTSTTKSTDKSSAFKERHLLGVSLKRSGKQELLGPNISSQKECMESTGFPSADLSYLYARLDTDAIKLRVEKEIRERWRQAVDQREAYEKLKTLRQFEQLMTKKILQAQQYEFKLQRLRLKLSRDELISS